MSPRTCKRSGEKKQIDKSEKLFKDTLTNLEKIARERIDTASDPFSVGVKMANQLRELAMKLEREVDSESTTATEASHTGGGIIGVGV